MHKKLTNSNKNLKYKTVKLDIISHKLLRIYAVENDFTLGNAIRNLLDKISKKK